MMSNLCPDNWLVYEQILASPDEVLNRFCQAHGLAGFEFSSWCNRDYNVTGLPYQSHDLWKSYFQEGIPVQVEQILGSINPVPDAA